MEAMLLLSGMNALTSMENGKPGGAARFFCRKILVKQTRI